MPHAELNAAIGRQIDDLPIDEETGSITVEPYQRICLLRDAASVADALENEEIEDDEIDFLVDQAGLIVTLDRTGAVNVRYFEDEDELEDRWSDLCDDLDADSEDDEYEEDDEEE